MNRVRPRNYLKDCPFQIRFNVKPESVNLGELTAFVAYAIAFPDANLALLDTYDVLRYLGSLSAQKSHLQEWPDKFSGRNPRPLRCRLQVDGLPDRQRRSGLPFEGNQKSLQSCGQFVTLFVVLFIEDNSRDSSLAWVEKLTIVASNDINEETIMSLNEQIVGLSRDMNRALSA